MLVEQLTSPAAGWVPTQGAMPKELLEETSALASLMTLLLDVPELVAAAPHAQLQAHSPWTQLLRCSFSRCSVSEMALGSCGGP